VQVRICRPVVSFVFVTFKLCVCVYIYIYIYIEREREREGSKWVVFGSAQHYLFIKYIMCVKSIWSVQTNTAYLINGPSYAN